MVLLSVAIVLQLYVIYVWFTLYKVVNRKVWYCVLAGTIVIVLYRLTELSAPSTQSMHYFLACLNSIFFAWAARLTRLEIRAQQKIADNLKVIIHAQIEPEPISLATELAKVLSQVRDKIDYYEKQAEENGLPKYPEQ